MAVNPELLEILVCPESKAPLIYFEDRDFFFCPESKLRYPIRDGIPVMMVDEAERLDDAEAGALVEEARARGLQNA